MLANDVSGWKPILTDPDVPIDTNHLERALRAIPMGKTRRQTRQHHAEFARHLPIARNRSVRLSRRCIATRRAASGQPGSGTYAEALEDALR